MRRHSVDVVPLVLLRKTPNEGPDAESYTTMSPARVRMERAIGYMLEAPHLGGSVENRPGPANARMLLRRCAPLDTNLQLRVVYMWRCRKPHRGSARLIVHCCVKAPPPSLTSGGQGTGVGKFRHVSGLIPQSWCQQGVNTTLCG